MAPFHPLEIPQSIVSPDISPLVHSRRRLGLVPIVLLAVAGTLTAGCKRSSPVPPQPYLAFVANSQGNSVAAVDLTSLQVVGSIPVPATPIQLAARPGARELYVLSASGVLTVIGFPGLRITHTLRIGGSAAGLVLAPDGRNAYVLDPAGGEIVFISCNPLGEVARLALGGRPSSFSLTPDGKTLIAADKTSDKLSFVGTATHRVLGVVKVGRAPGPMAILPDSSEVFVADTRDRKISAVDVPSRTLLSNIELAAPATSLELKPDGGEIFALSYPGSDLIILDAFHDDVEQTLTAGLHPVAGVFRKDQSVFYLATAGDGNVTAFDVQTRNVLAVTHAGTEPSALALTPDERFLAVTDAASASLAVLRADTLGLVTTIPVGSRPVDVVIPAWLRKK
jgi:DNA-binding beta-propeller fold protein YncE